MTRDEVKKLIATMEATYPNYHPGDRTFTVNAWASMLEEYDFRQVQMAFKKFVLSDTGGFAPSIGQLVARIHEIAAGDDLGEIEAWSLVSKAIKNSNYHAKEEFEKLPQILQRVVYSPSNLRDWAAADTDTVNSAVQSHVIRNYRAAAKAAREEAKLPPKFQAALKAQQSKPERLVSKEPDGTEEGGPEPPSLETAREHSVDPGMLIGSLKERLARKEKGEEST